jgi:predicted transcriptional regulator
MSKMHRAQILLDPDQHDALAEIAQRDGSSISEIVRNVVESWLIERRQE